MQEPVPVTGDHAWARRLAALDASAVDAFYRAHCDAIYRFVWFRVGRSDQDAEDVTADTFLTALRVIGSWSGRAELAVWLRGIARNKCRERMKALARRRRAFGAASDATVALALERIDQGDLPPEVLASKETASAVGAALSHLPPHYERVLRQKYVDDLTFAQIGEASGSSAKAAESLVQRAKVAFARLVRTFAGSTGVSGSRRDE